MKVLWITNMPFAHHNKMLGKGDIVLASGSWLYAAFESIKDNNSIDLHIATSDNVKTLLSDKIGNCNFYILPGGLMNTYDYNSNQNKAQCRQFLDKVKPDIVVLWGTESRFAYQISSIIEDVPVVVYIQGVVNSILNHYDDGVPTKYRLLTPQDFVFKFHPSAGINAFKKQAKLETDILKKAKAVIVENDWCEYQCKIINPGLSVYRNCLPIKREFYENTWSFDNMDPYTIFTNAGGRSIKGHHILFEALGIIKNTCPEVKLLIPGHNYLAKSGSIKHTSGYLLYLRSIINKYQLQDNIKFVGLLDSRQMADYISRCNVYAMPSMIENHSSSLIEALIVGAPCVSSLVGGVGSLIQNNKNGIIYNSLEPESLAGAILRIFNDTNFANTLSKNATRTKETRTGNFGEEIIKICKSVSKQ